MDARSAGEQNVNFERLVTTARGLIEANFEPTIRAVLLHNTISMAMRDIKTFLPNNTGFQAVSADIGEDNASQKFINHLIGKLLTISVTLVKQKEELISNCMRYINKTISYFSNRELGDEEIKMACKNMILPYIDYAKYDFCLDICLSDVLDQISPDLLNSKRLTYPGIEEGMTSRHQPALDALRDRAATFCTTYANDAGTTELLNTVVAQENILMGMKELPQAFQDILSLPEQPEIPERAVHIRDLIADCLNQEKQRQTDAFKSACDALQGTSSLLYQLEKDYGRVTPGEGECTPMRMSQYFQLVHRIHLATAARPADYDACQHRFDQELSSVRRTEDELVAVCFARPFIDEITARFMAQQPVAVPPRQGTGALHQTESSVALAPDAEASPGDDAQAAPRRPASG
ncbi:MAG TPA: hypothetical protein VNC84_02860 [Gammaproteobacteria bacterium]|jgi:hypothetical protein|nr:hypothetical protein [Gammaproteobacteria bacterium]